MLAWYWELRNIPENDEIMNDDTSIAIVYESNLLLCILGNCAMFFVIPGTSVTDWLVTVDAVESRWQLSANTLVQITDPRRRDCLVCDLQF